MEKALIDTVDKLQVNWDTELYKSLEQQVHVFNDRISALEDILKNTTEFDYSCDLTFYKTKFVECSTFEEKASIIEQFAKKMKKNV